MMYSKMPITSRIRKDVWKKYIGKREATAICFCCKKAEMVLLDESTWQAGHVIADTKGGTIDLFNMRPICRPCNQHMSKTNMRVFMKEKGYGDLQGSGDPEDEKDSIIMDLRAQNKKMTEELNYLQGRFDAGAFISRSLIHGVISTFVINVKPNDPANDVYQGWISHLYGDEIPPSKSVVHTRYLSHDSKIVYDKAMAAGLL